MRFLLTDLLWGWTAVHTAWFFAGTSVVLAILYWVETKRCREAREQLHQFLEILREHGII